jgi:hypothetical protein
VTAGDADRTIGLPDGRDLTISVVTRADVEGLAAVYGGLTDDDLHDRFFHV